MLPDCLLMTFFALQGHVPLLYNPPQPEDAVIHDEPDASAADDVTPIGDVSVPVGATGADESAGVELPGTGDSEDSDPLRIKRSQSSGVDDRDATSGAVPPDVPSAEPSPPVVARKKPRLGRMVRTHYERTG